MGSTWYKVPLWAQKSWGPWTTYGGGGETLFDHAAHAIGYQNFPFAGWLLQRDIGKKLTLGGEVFYHGVEGLAIASRQGPQPCSTWAAITNFARSGISTAVRVRSHHRGAKRKLLRLPGAVLDLGQAKRQGRQGQCTERSRPAS